MIKIKLGLDDLRVESFATSGADRGKGTVVGHAESQTTCGGNTRCGVECETWYGNGFCSADDGCNSSPHAFTPCAGCAETSLCFPATDGCQAL